MAQLAKSVLVCILLFLMVCLMTIQKTFLLMSVRMISHISIDQASGYAILCVLLLSPYVFSIFLTLWNVPFLKKAESCRLPPVQNILLGIFAAVVEGVCVVTFTTRVLALLPVFVVLPAAHGVLAVTAIISSFKKNKYTKTSDIDQSGESTGDISRVDDDWWLCCHGARIMASSMCLLGPPAVAGFLYLMGLATAVSAFTLAITPCILGLLWTPDLQAYIIDPKHNMSVCYKRFQLLYAIIKAFSVLLFILTEMYLRSEVSAHENVFVKFTNGFSVFWKTYAFVPLFIYFLSCLIGFGISFLSLTLCQPMFGIVLPSLLSMVIAVVLCASYSTVLYGVDETTHFGEFAPFLVSSSVLAFIWAWPYILNSSSYLRKRPHVLTPYKALFPDYGWNAIFNEQRLLISCTTGELLNMSTTDSSKIVNRIYICTTMYREADYEMERLLMSLENLTTDPLLSKIHFEANIFMDNGCSGDSLNEFALQCVSLLVEKVGVELERTKCCRTPYGIQIFCKLKSGLPLFLHLKDPKKVKGKKRWSQVMYINYVMKFRKAQWLQDTENKDFDTIYHTQNSTKFIEEMDKDILQNLDVMTHGEFMLRRVPTIGYPTVADLRLEADSDQGFASVEDSAPSHSDSGSQASHSSSCKESSDVDSLTEETNKGASVGGYIDTGFQHSLNTEKHQNLKAAKTVSYLDSTYGKVLFDVTASVDDDHTFILATDADMDFKGTAIRELLDLCNSDKRIGAACGRTHPIGKKRSSIVWHQVFEYAKDFWMIKNAQNIIGSVSCCPGCFSLYRASAINDVIAKYATPTRSPYTVYVKDTGEDRWMATLMMINGWRLRYSPFADNTTYCPDSFQEYYKQRRRWILSDIANAVLVVQNLFKLVRNNECFSFIYVIYLVNMFLNNIITPGTAIVMITAGLELVFDIPYVYTTAPMASLVYLYAFLCTCTSVRTQGILTSVLTAIMGCLFASVAIFGTYKITAGMVEEIQTGHFQFQQHYIILLLALSLFYAAMMHPRESYQIVYGLAYLFIFPAMHVLLPIYSIANIVDQSWGTRDSNKAKIPALSCLKMSFLKRKKKRKDSGSKDSSSNSIGDDDTKTAVQETIVSRLKNMSEGDKQSQEENQFWEDLKERLLGNDVNTGLEKAELAEGLRRLRNRTLSGMLIINALWLALLSYFYMGLDSPLSRLNIYGIISGALYGFTLLIQVLGLTAGRVEQVLRRLAKAVYGNDVPIWVHERDEA